MFLVVTIGLILVFLTPLGRQVGIGDIGIPEIIFGGDDWAGTPDASSFSSWRTKSEGGLRLTIENALTSDWHPYFSVAFADWDAAPALELTLAKREEGPDPLCDPVEGIMKVCNARYGVTGWVGLNEVYFNQKGFITQSVAKMNESYLKFSNQDEKQYVVCVSTELHKRKWKKGKQYCFFFPCSILPCHSQAPLILPLFYEYFNGLHF